MAFSARVGRWFVAGSMVVGLGGCGGSVAIDFVGADGGNGSGGAGGSGGEPCPEGETRIDGECVDDGVDPGPVPDPECDQTNLKLDQVNARWQGGFESVVMLRNVSADCTVDLSGLSLGVYSDELRNVSLSGGLASDGIYTLASGDLGTTVDQTAAAVSFQGNSAWIALCVGPCDASDGSNVVDLVVLGSSDGFDVYAPAPPSGTAFSGEALVRLDGDSELYGAYYRTAVSDGFYTSTDWSGAVILDPNVGGDGGPLRAVGTPPILFVSDDATAGRHFLFSNESQVEGTYEGFETLGPAGFRPRYAKARFYVGPGLFTAFVFGGTGSPMDTTAGAIHLLLDETGIAINGAYFPFEPGTEGWFQVEFQNVDWSLGLFDFWFAGEPLQTSIPMNPVVAEGLAGDVIGIYAVNGGNATGFTEVYLVE